MLIIHDYLVVWKSWYHEMIQGFYSFITFSCLKGIRFIKYGIYLLRILTITIPFYKTTFIQQTEKLNLVGFVLDFWLLWRRVFRTLRFSTIFSYNGLARRQKVRQTMVHTHRFRPWYFATPMRWSASKERKGYSNLLLNIDSLQPTVDNLISMYS